MRRSGLPLRSGQVSGTRSASRTRITHPDPATNPIWFRTDYDALNRPTMVWANGATAMASMGYYAHGAPAGRSLANGATSEWGYDGVQRVAAVVQGAAGTSADLFLSLAYNPASQIASRNLNNDAYAWTGHYAVTRPYTANGLNQYTAAGGPAMSYDPNGNLTSDGANNNYAYDIENRLVSASGAHNAALAYDPLGRLSQITLGANTTRFLYDGDALIAEYDGAGVMQRRYVHWVGDDTPLLSYAGATLNQPSYLHADQQGSIILVTDQSGNPSVNRYDEYGIPQSTNTGRFQYTGQAYLAELGLYYYKARFYSPTFGRFLQIDPVGYADQYNLYAYVGNDPMNLVDPTGQFRLKGDTRQEAERFVQTINPVSRTQYRVDLLSEIRINITAQPNLSGSPTLSSDIDAMRENPQDFVVHYGNWVTENGARFNVDLDFGGGVTYRGNLLDSTTTIVLSGNGSFAANAEGGGHLLQSPAMVAIHEVVREAVPRGPGEPSGGLARENQVLDEIGQRRRAPDSGHPY